MTDNADLIAHLDFPTVVACMGAKSDGENITQCSNPATRILTREHAASDDPDKCMTNRYPVCEGHAAAFRAAMYREFYKTEKTVWHCLKCDARLKNPDAIVSVHPLFGKDTPQP
jgi:hypothetical protein